MGRGFSYTGGERCLLYKWGTGLSVTGGGPGSPKQVGRGVSYTGGGEGSLYRWGEVSSIQVGERGL